MAKAKKNSTPKKVEVGEQKDLLDVNPAASKKIIQIAKAYKTAQANRANALAEEVEYKGKLLECIKKEKLQPLEDGSVKFTVDGYTITVKPRDELVQVKCPDEE